MRHMYIFSIARRSRTFDLWWLHRTHARTHAEKNSTHRRDKVAISSIPTSWKFAALESAHETHGGDT